MLENGTSRPSTRLAKTMLDAYFASKDAGVAPHTGGRTASLKIQISAISRVYTRRRCFTGISLYCLQNRNHFARRGVPLFMKIAASTYSFSQYADGRIDAAVNCIVKAKELGIRTVEFVDVCPPGGNRSAGLCSPPAGRNAIVCEHAGPTSRWERSCFIPPPDKGRKLSGGKKGWLIRRHPRCPFSAPRCDRRLRAGVPLLSRL